MDTLSHEVPMNASEWRDPDRLKALSLIPSSHVYGTRDGRNYFVASQPDARGVRRYSIYTVDVDAGTIELASELGRYATRDAAHAAARRRAERHNRVGMEAIRQAAGRAAPHWFAPARLSALRLRPASFGWLTPGGHRAYFVASQLDPDQGHRVHMIFVCDLLTGQIRPIRSPRSFAAGSHADERDYAWTHDEAKRRAAEDNPG